jgi:hypothetical protein
MKKKRRYLNGLEALFCFGKSTGVGEGNVIIIFSINKLLDRWNSIFFNS